MALKVDTKCEMCRIESADTVLEEEVATVTKFPIPRNQQGAQDAGQRIGPLNCAETSLRGSIYASCLWLVSKSVDH